MQVLAVGVGVLLGVSVPDVAEARTACTYAGAPMNVLTISVSSDVEAVITRSGMEITAGESRRPLARCTGGIPTVLNTDTINLRLSGLPFVDVRLDGGPLAPGATAESTGTSEIEIQISGEGVSTSVVGTARDDEFRWGAGASGAGLNVNPGAAGDVDVTVTGGPDDVAPLLVADGARATTRSPGSRP